MEAVEAEAAADGALPAAGESQREEALAAAGESPQEEALEAELGAEAR